jgi:hypothetical protein
MTSKFGNMTRKECTYKKGVVYYETPYCFEIDFLHPANTKAMDEIQNLLLDIISYNCLHSDRHIILCYNIDAIEDIYSFRVLLERYSKNAMFVCHTNSISNVECPLRSRFHEVRIPLFSQGAIEKMMSHIGSQMHPILKSSNCRNIFKVIVVADILENQPLIDPSPLCLYTYPDLYRFMTDIKRPTIEEMREIASKVCYHNVTIPQLVQDLLHHVPNDKKADFIRRASETEHALAKTNRGRMPIYYEYIFHIAIYGKQM